MLVSLYTSRVVLNTLGVEDYGTYAIVGGVVAMFGFLNSSMASATQRFLAYEIGRGDSQMLKNVFNMSINVHFLIAIIVVILAETAGLWFLNNKLTLPLERIDAAQWVYQFSVLAFVVGILSVPYNAMIIAQEKMNVYAWVSIMDVIFKLLVAFLLLYVSFDKLKLYAILIFSVSFITTSVYILYCRISFKETKFKFIWDAGLFKRIFSHSGWMLFGTSSNMLSTQGVNILMNMFFGVTVNAARGIAVQIQAIVNSFVNNFMMAVQPQIIKNYAQNNYKEMYKLVFSSSKYSFFLVFILSLPILFLTETIISWWLGMVPEHVVLYTRLILIDLLIITQYPSIASVSQATGKIKYYQLTISLGFLLTFVFTYILYKLDFPSHYAFLIMIVMSVLGLAARLLILRSQLSFPINEYVKKVVLKVLVVVMISLPIPYLFYHFIENEIYRFFAICVSSLFLCVISIWFWGLEDNERGFFRLKLKTITKKLKW